MEISRFLLWFKAFHLAFMVTWFAGLFYLPRLFIYHAEAADAPSRLRFTLMEKRLFGIMTIGAIMTAIFGALLLYLHPALLSQTWFQIKIVFLLGMLVYHWHCRRWIYALESTMEVQGSTGLRWFNEIPVIFLLGILFLAILKPF